MATKKEAAQTAAVWLGCLAPTAALNIYPHLAALADPGPVGMVPHIIMIVAKSAFVVGAAYLLVKAETVATRKQKTACYLVWCAVASVCFYNAMEGGGRLRDQLAGPAREWQVKGAAIKSRIASLDKSRAEVPPHSPASPAMVESARGAVAAAEKSRADECAKRGPFCRDREADERSARDRLAEVEGRAMATTQVAEIDAELKVKRAELDGLGEAPKHADPAAARLALIFGTDEETVADWWPIWLAVAIEIWATLGAYCFLPRPAKHRGSIADKPAMLTPERVEPIAAGKVEKKPAAPRKTAVRASPATPAKSRKPLKKQDDGASTVRDWYSGSVYSREGAEMRVKEVRAHYEAHCEGRGLEPVSLTVFGTMMKKELGVNYIERSKRGFYTGIALKTLPVLAVVNK